jgi:hypothetical protein
MPLPKSALNRLAALEARTNTDYKPPNPWPQIVMSAIGYHLGGWAPDGKRSLAECYAKACGWVTDADPTLRRMQRAMHDGDPEFDGRHGADVGRSRSRFRSR